MEDARSKGAQVLTGGARPQLEGKLAEGHFFEPTVVADATIDMRIYKEETFGPAIMLLKFKHDHEAIQYANDTEYGLAAYYYTKACALSDDCIIDRAKETGPHGHRAVLFTVAVSSLSE